METNVTMTADELKEFEAFKAAQAAKRSIK